MISRGSSSIERQIISRVRSSIQRGIISRVINCFCKSQFFKITGDFQDRHFSFHDRIPKWPRYLPADTWLTWQQGLRSKSLRKHKAVRRAEIYEPVETARIHRLAAKTTQGMSIDTLASVTADSSAEKESGNMEIDGNSSTMSKMERARLLLSKNQFKKLVLRQKKEKIRKTGRKV